MGLQVVDEAVGAVTKRKYEAAKIRVENVEGLHGLFLGGAAVFSACALSVRTQGRWQPVFLLPTLNLSQAKW